MFSFNQVQFKSPIEIAANSQCSICKRSTSQPVSCRDTCKLVKNNSRAVNIVTTEERGIRSYKNYINIMNIIGRQRFMDIIQSDANLIWLCHECNIKIKSRTYRNAFTVDRLLEIKKNHEIECLPYRDDPMDIN